MGIIKKGDYILESWLIGTGGNETMREVYSTQFMIKADMIKSILEDNSVKCILWDRRMGTVYPVIQIRVMVREEDFDKANKIVQNYRKESKEMIMDM